MNDETPPGGGASAFGEIRAPELCQVARALGVEEVAWARVLSASAARCRGKDVPARLAALASAWAEVEPRAAPLPGSLPARSCPICAARPVAPHVARRSSERGDLVYSRCPRCGHGVQVAGGAAPGLYRDDAYFRHRTEGGAGYDDYASEALYREEKGKRLCAFVVSVLGRPVERLLEVGSGYGYTRRAAEEQGIATTGVDVNPAAAAEARRRYGLETITSSLKEALSSGAVPAASVDVVLYQFVLEHVADPVDELRCAAAALSPAGVVVLVVPSMEAVELEVFGASYRSLRSDHLHLFTRRSLELALEAAGLSVRTLVSGCSRHLLGCVLAGDELAALYAAGQGPDLVVVAERAT